MVHWLIDWWSIKKCEKRRRNKTKFLNQWELRELQIDYNRFFSFDRIPNEKRKENRFFFGGQLFTRSSRFSSSPRKLFNRIRNCHHHQIIISIALMFWKFFFEDSWKKPEKSWLFLIVCVLKSFHNQHHPIFKILFLDSALFVCHQTSSFRNKHLTLNTRTFEHQFFGHLFNHLIIRSKVFFSFLMGEK